MHKKQIKLKADLIVNDRTPHDSSHYPIGLTVQFRLLSSCIVFSSDNIYACKSVQESRTSLKVKKNKIVSVCEQ